VAYDPPRHKTPNPADDPLEVQLVFDVRPCGTCSFFWPQNPAQQPYGPYPAYDFDSNTPAESAPNDTPKSYQWLSGTTRPPSFPDAEIMDGCRKAPIMTIGINPNLTAFLPGQAGASWCYPSFSSDNGTDSWTKYAYYYRYRSLYQERFDPQFVRQFLAQEGRIVAAKPGVIVSADRPSDAPSWEIRVRYDGQEGDTSIALASRIGEPGYVLFFDPVPPHNRFCEGDLIAARLAIPGGRKAQIYAQQIGYYQRIVPVLARFESFLHDKGHAAARLRVGEDVCQLDMVACASPHWGPPWLGGSAESVHSIIANCVSKNAWAIKQLVQTRPTVLLLVGEAAFNMFRYAFGSLIKANPPLPAVPDDGAFSLLRATTDPTYPCLFEFSGDVDGHAYSISTRLVVAPHFSYAENFSPQFRLSSRAWDEFTRDFPGEARFLRSDPRIRYMPPKQAGEFVAIEIVRDADHVVAEIEQTSRDAAHRLMPAYYDANAMMAGVLLDLYAKRQLTYVDATETLPGFLARNDGPCSFCTNRHWKFPLGCPYGKPAEEPLPIGLLESVAAEIARSGAQPQPEVALHRMMDDGFEARRGPNAPRL
jgi:hypothetical protein